MVYVFGGGHFWLAVKRLNQQTASERGSKNVGTPKPTNPQTRIPHPASRIPQLASRNPQPATRIPQPPNPMPPQFISAFLVAFVASAALTPLVRALARRWEIVAKPRADRWHQTPTALLGGIAIVASMLISSLLVASWNVQSVAVMSAAGLLFVVGLIDDIRGSKPYQKLIAQILAGIIVIASGLLLPWTPWIPLNMAITLLWLVGITNAVNLLDNMDGLAAGISAIAGIFVAANLAANGQPADAVLATCLVATTLGFLIYNSNPASIFMGDCGSMFLGFFLAGISLASLSGGRLQSFPVLIVPVLVLVIPIFDTTLVSIVRRISGRAISQGGRDHTSHRLVALGMSERRAVWMLYTLATASGVLGLFLRGLPLDAALAVMSGVTIGLTILGIYLGQVSVYDPDQVAHAHSKPVVSFLIDLSYKRRVFEVLLDVVLVALAYYSAQAILFGSVLENGHWQQFVRVLPVLVAVKLPVFLVLGVYRGLWRYASVDDLVVFAKAVLISTVAVILVLLVAYRFQGFSRAAFALDALILFMLLAGSRFGFRLLRSLMPAPQGGCQGDKRRVLIYGAGDGGELLLRELRNNGQWQADPVGFVDDDHRKEGKLIHGLRVFGGNGSLGTIIDQQQVDEVVISSGKVPHTRVAEIRGVCESENVVLRRMRITIDEV